MLCCVVLCCVVLCCVVLCCVEDRWFEVIFLIKVRMVAHCPPSSKWVSAGNAGKIKAARKQLATLPHYIDSP